MYLLVAPNEVPTVELLVMALGASSYTHAEATAIQQLLTLVADVRRTLSSGRLVPPQSLTSADPVTDDHNIFSLL